MVPLSTLNADLDYSAASWSVKNLIFELFVFELGFGLIFDFVFGFVLGFEFDCDEVSYRTVSVRSART